MGQRSRRTLPDRSVPFLNPDGTVALEWYTYLKWHDEEHGGQRFDRLLRSPTAGGVLNGASGIAGAAGTVLITIDGTDYNVVVE